MDRKIVDTLGFGFLVWFVIYLMGFVIVTIPGYPESVSTPAILIPLSLILASVAAAFAFLRFRNRQPINWSYATFVGVSWLMLAIILDFIFIVLLFNAPSYYRLDIFVYYAITLIIPPIVVRYASSRKHSD